MDDFLSGAEQPLDAWKPCDHPVPRDQMKSLIIGRSCCHHHHIVRFGAMVGKVNVTQTQVCGTQWDFNTSALACNVRSFLNIVTNAPEVQQRRCGH